jgi:hypothetical protein
VNTRIGKIAVQSRNVDSVDCLLIHLHGLYFEDRLWDHSQVQVKDKNIEIPDM